MRPIHAYSAAACGYLALLVGAALFAPTSWLLSLATLGALGMTVSASYAVSLNGGGINFAKTIVRTGDAATVAELVISAGKTVTAWVDTDSNTAACNLPSGHGYSNGNFDVYWSSGGVNYCRRNVPGTISTNALSLDGGSGDNFPTTGTTGVVVCKQTAFNALIDGDNCKIVGILAEVAAIVTTQQHVRFLDGSSAEVVKILLNANEPSICDITGGATNLYTGNVITNGVASNGDPTYDATIKIVAVYDSTP